MTPEGERLEGTFVQWVAVAIWYCAGQDYNINQPSPPVTLSEAVSHMRAYNAEFDVDEVVTPEEVEAALHTLHAAGEATRDDVGRWSARAVRSVDLSPRRRSLRGNGSAAAIRSRRPSRPPSLPDSERSGVLDLLGRLACKIGEALTGRFKCAFLNVRARERGGHGGAGRHPGERHHMIIAICGRPRRGGAVPAAA